MHYYSLAALPAQEPQEVFSLPLVISGVPYGYVHSAVSPSALLSITHHAQPAPQSTSRFHPALAEALRDYMNGSAVAWPVPVALPESPFLLRCWQELAAIPYGEVITYSALAARAGNPCAIRAAASACARNPVPLVIPCHRVIAKNGTLGGFGWGLPVKQALLQREQSQAGRPIAA